RSSGGSGRGAPPPASDRKRGFTAPVAGISEDLERDRLAVARSGHLQQRPERLGDAPVAADDLAHVVLGDVELDDGPALVADDLDLDRVRVVDERLGDVFDEFGCCHRAPYSFGAAGPLPARVSRPRTVSG